jgi:hypothetical protein
MLYANEEEKRSRWSPTNFPLVHESACLGQLYALLKGQIWEMSIVKYVWVDYVILICGILVNVDNEDWNGEVVHKYGFKNAQNNLDRLGHLIIIFQLQGL